MLSEGSSEGWKWGFGLVAAGGCERRVGMGAAGLGSTSLWGLPGGDTGGKGAVPMSPARLGVLPGVVALGLSQGSPKPPFPGHSRSSVPRGVAEGSAGTASCSLGGSCPVLGASGAQKFPFSVLSQCQHLAAAMAALGTRSPVAPRGCASAGCPSRGVTSGSQLAQGHSGEPGRASGMGSA